MHQPIGEVGQITHALEDRAVLYAPGVFGQLLGREMPPGQPLVEPLGRFDNPAAVFRVVQAIQAAATIPSTSSGAGICPSIARSWRSSNARWTLAPKSTGSGRGISRP